MIFYRFTRFFRNWKMIVIVKLSEIDTEGGRVIFKIPAETFCELVTCISERQTNYVAFWFTCPSGYISQIYSVKELKRLLDPVETFLKVIFEVSGNPGQLWT